jgi:hypothetical protein
MRYYFAIVVAALWAGSALADEPSACYIARDPTGDFVSNRMRAIDADPETGAQVRHLLNQDSRATAKCVQRYVEREGREWPNGATVLYGLRISPAGKLTQVSVLEADNINDAMLMACLGRTVCKWELEAHTDSQERLIKLPFVMVAPLQRPKFGSPIPQ